MNNIFKIVFFSVAILLLTAQPVWAASTKQELAEIKASQESIQKELAEIKKLLKEGARAPAAAAQPGFKPSDINVENAPFLGNVDATVTLIEFSDYQCPFCSRHYRQVMPDLEKDYIESGQLKYVMRENPIQSIHSRAMAASQAGLCAHDQGKYWEMHNLMFDNQKELDVDNLKAFAVTLGLDSSAFDACLDDKKYEKQVNDDLAQGASLGVRGTPAFVLGITDPDDPNKVHVTQFINGAKSLGEFKSTIDRLLEEAEED
jgi:protein-disulfide isomerase